MKNSRIKKLKSKTKEIKSSNNSSSNAETSKKT